MNFRPFVREHLPTLGIDREAEILDELAEHLDDIYREARDEALDHPAAVARAVAALETTTDDLACVLRRVAGRMAAVIDEPLPPSTGALRMWTDLRRDCRYAVRMLIREPGFTAAVAVTLALGIGATSTIFTAVDALLLKSAAVADPARVVSVYTVWAAKVTSNANGGDQLGGTSYPDYADLRDSGVLQGLAAFAGVALTLDLNGVTEQIDADIVSGDYFDVLGVRPRVGRNFVAGEDRIGSPVRVVVLSHRTWVQRFGGDPAIVGRSITLNGGGYTVIGVAPRGFLGTVPGEVPEAWLPMALQPELRPPSPGLRQRLRSVQMLAARDVRWLSLVGRLKAGASLADTAASLDTVGRRLAVAQPASNKDLSATAVALGEGPGARTSVRPTLALLGSAVILVLMIACANAAGLLLERAVTRRREVAVRMAIGAARGQLVRQWLTEAVILGGLGAAGGLMLAAWGAPILHGLGVPAGVDLGLNPRVLAFTLATGVATGLFFGLAPVYQLIREDTVSALRDEGSGVSTGARANRSRSTFVVLQVALSFALLVGAGLFIRTLQQAYAVDLGYHLDHMLVADISGGDRYSPEAWKALHDRFLERVNALPGVVSASAARITVLSGVARTVPVSVDGQPLRPDMSNVMPARANVVSERYLETMGITVLRGRGFGPSDLATAPRVAIVSRSLAARLWPHLDPVGQSFFSTSRLQVVGVVPDSVYLRATERDPRPFFYVPLTQHDEPSLALHVRTADDPLAILPAVRHVLRDIDPRLALTRPRRLTEEFQRSMTAERTMAMVVGVLGGIALVLAAVGLYGIMAYATRQRTAEIGLRLALGATPASVLHLIVMRGARLLVIGIGIGLTGAFIGARYLRSQLFGVEPTDPWTWFAVFGVLALIGLAACAIPARRAMRIDPARALRAS